MKISAVAVLACAAALASCNRSGDITEERAHEVSKTEAAPPLIAPPPDTPAAARYSESGVATVTEQNVDIVNSVAIRYPTNATDSLVIRATGIADSQGWWNPRLVPLDQDTSDTTVMRFRLVATPPNGEAAGLGGPLHVQLRVDGVRRDVKAIEVASATNSVSVMIVRPEPAQTAQLR